MRPARSLNPTPIGIAFIALVAVLMYTAMNIGNISFLGGGATYSAAFTEAAGLQRGNDVMVGGVRVGKVDSVELEGTHVRVEFSVSGVRVGSSPELTIGIGTLLGNKFLDLEPTGEGTWDPDEQIPLERTTSPYDVIEAFADLTTTVQEIDTAQLAEAFTTMADTFRDAPPHLRGALDGMARMSASISSRDAALSELLAHTESVTQVLADRRTQLTTLMGDGSLLLREIEVREQEISRLLTATADLSVQLSGVVDDNEAIIGPAMAQLRDVTTILEENRANLDEFLQLIYPTTRVLIDTTASGPWFDGILGGVTPIPNVPGLPPLAPVDVPRTLGELLGIPSAGAR